METQLSYSITREKSSNKGASEKNKRKHFWLFFVLFDFKLRLAAEAEA